MDEEHCIEYLEQVYCTMKYLCLRSDVYSRYTVQNAHDRLLCLYDPATLVIGLSHFELTLIWYCIVWTSPVVYPKH
jgi:hypothetical protein